MTYLNVVIAGDVGTGTTTLAKNLAQKLNWQFISAGEFFRKYCQDHNIPLWDKAQIPDETEKEIDFGLQEKLTKETNLVVEGHYTGWFMKDNPNIFRILLTCDRSVANQRMLSRKHTHQETLEEIDKRRAGLYAKFKKLYSQDDYEDPKFYNLVLDTTHTTPQKTFEDVLNNLNS